MLGIKGLGAIPHQPLHGAGSACPGIGQLGTRNVPQVESDLVNISLPNHLQSMKCKPLPSKGSFL